MPTTLLPELQRSVLDVIEERARGIHVALATLGIRLSEARVLCIRHWQGGLMQIREGAKDR